MPGNFIHNFKSINPYLEVFQELFFNIIIKLLIWVTFECYNTSSNGNSLYERIKKNLAYFKMLSRDCIAKMYIKCHTGVNQIFEMVKQVRFKCAAGFISENNSNMLSFSFHSLVSHKFYFVLRPDTDTIRNLSVFSRRVGFFNSRRVGFFK